jgi:hypothetical protein
MSTFIARMIESQFDKSEEAGQAKYKAYFITTQLYAKWKTEVDTILNTDGYEDAIVTQ